MSARARLRAALQAGASLSGLAALYVRAARVRGAVILMYHSVAEAPGAAWMDPDNHLAPARFERHVRFLARHRRVVPMSELVAALASGRELPAGTVAITFDDGYLDTLTVAAPILARYGVPATLYLATGYVTREENQWIDQLFAIFKARTRHELAPPWETGAAFDLRRPAEAATAYARAARALLGLADGPRRAALAELAARLQPEARPPRLTLSWAEVAELARRHPSIEIGGHTRDHVDLRDRAAGEVEDQIRGCFDDLRGHLDARPRHFSFPYGRWCERSKAILRDCGAASGVGSGPDVLLTPRNDRLALPRVEAPGSGIRLSFVTSGAHPGLLRALGGGS